MTAADTGPPDIPAPIDDGSAAYEETDAEWDSTCMILGGDFSFDQPGSQDGSATWAFNLVPGTRYEVIATWVAGPDRATNAEFTIRDGLQIEGVAEVDQQRSPVEISGFGRSWKSLGAFTVDSGTLRVHLSGEADGTVGADAVGIVEVARTTTAPPVLDDGDAAFVERSGQWQRLGDDGAYGGDLRYHESGEGDHATTWTFDALEPGLSYRVYATWPEVADPAVAGRLAADAPFEVFDGQESVGRLRVDQQVRPDDLEGEGHGWQLLGVYRIDSGTMTVRLSDDAGGVVLADAVVTAAVRERAAPAEISQPPGGGGMLLAGSGYFGAAVVDRHVFYNNSSWDGDEPAANEDDDDAIAPHEWTSGHPAPDPPGENLGKVALLPAETAAFNHYTSYSRGINGVMIDVAGLADTPTSDDFEFHVGNDNDPDGWSSAPDPSTITVRAGAGTDGADRITIIWDDSDIRGEWLEVRMLTAEVTGLATDEVFYFGNATAESGNSTSDAQVTITDLLRARNNPHNFMDPAPIDDFVDFNRDERVNSTDVVLARNNQTNFLNRLNLIILPAADIEIERFHTEDDLLKVYYTISGGYTLQDPAPEFDVTIYSSPDGVVPETKLVETYTVDTTSMLIDGSYTVQISPEFLDQGGGVYDLEEDYYLVAVVHADVDVVGNNALFEGGIFRAEDGTVHVHGLDIADVDPELDKQDSVYVSYDDPDYDITMGQLTPSYSENDVTEFHIRTHDGSDLVTTPNPGEMNDSGIDRVMWIFGGPGHDGLAGGDLDDLLYGGPGEDGLSGRPGDDTIYGEDGDDELEGHNGADRIEGGPGNDIIEGWGDTDYIYGGPGDDMIRGGMPWEAEPATPDLYDCIFGGDGNDRIDGHIGGDLLVGDGPNVHDGPAGSEPGNDEIYGFDGYDYIYGGDGHDDLFGEEDGASIDAGDGDDIVNGTPPLDYPQANLVADVDDDGNFDAFYGSEDNREENGFFGGKEFILTAAREKVEIYFYQNDDDPDFDNYTLRLENSNEDLLDFYTAPTDGTKLDEPPEWTIDQDVMSLEVYVECVQTGGGQLTLSVVEPVVGRPLADLLMYGVV